MIDSNRDLDRVWDETCMSCPNGLSLSLGWPFRTLLLWWIFHSSADLLLFVPLSRHLPLIQSSTFCICHDMKTLLVIHVNLRTHVQIIFYYSSATMFWNILLVKISRGNVIRTTCIPHSIAFPSFAVRLRRHGACMTRDRHIDTGSVEFCSRIHPKLNIESGKWCNMINVKQYILCSRVKVVGNVTRRSHLYTVMRSVTLSFQNITSPFMGIFFTGSVSGLWVLNSLDIIWNAFRAVEHTKVNHIEMKSHNGAPRVISMYPFSVIFWNRYIDILCQRPSLDRLCSRKMIHVPVNEVNAKIKTISNVIHQLRLIKLHDFK